MQGVRGRKLKQALQTTETSFTMTTRKNMVAKLLLADTHFAYVLLSMFFGEALKEFFGQSGKKRSKNFYFYKIDILAASKIVNLRAFILHGVVL